MAEAVGNFPAEWNRRVPECPVSLKCSFLRHVINILFYYRCVMLSLPVTPPCSSVARDILCVEAAGLEYRSVCGGLTT